MKPTKKTTRIDCLKDGVDDVAIGPVAMFRLERMHARNFWCCVYLPDGSSHTFRIFSDRKITVLHEED